jgi:hypothetical protein
MVLTLSISLPRPTALTQQTVNMVVKPAEPGLTIHKPGDEGMDGINRHADPEIPADEIHLRLVAFQSGRYAAPTVVHIQRPVDLAQRPSGRTARRKTTLRTLADASDVVSKSWTAARQTTIR